MTDISMIVNLGSHAVEINDNNSVLIAAHPSDDTDTIECVQLSADEAYRLYVTLAGVYANEPQQAPENDGFHGVDEECDYAEGPAPRGEGIVSFYAGLSRVACYHAAINRLGDGEGWQFLIEGGTFRLI